MSFTKLNYLKSSQCVDWSKNVPDGDADREDHITKSISICKQACSGDDNNNEKT